MSKLGIQNAWDGGGGVGFSSEFLEGTDGKIFA